MDGVERESNTTDDPQDEWSIYSEISEAADALVNGTQTSGLQFVRANGSSLDVEVQAEEGYLFLQFLWTISFGRYTRCITAPEDWLMKGVFPLNPLVLLNYARAAVSKGLYCMNA